MRRKNTDGGWAWVVLTSSFTAYFISCGLFYNIGIYFVSFLDAFDESRSYTAWVGALLVSMFHIAGPISSFLLPYVGARGIFVIGGFLMGLSYALLYLAQSILYIIIIYGLFGGIGCFFVISGCLTAVANYFQKRLYLAAGIMSAGGGLGTLAVGIFTETFVEHYGWRGSLLLMSGISLQICVCGALVFPNEEEDPPGTNKKNSKRHPDVQGTTTKYHFLSDGRFWCLSLCTMTMNMAGFSMYVFLKDIMLSKGDGFAPEDYKDFVVWLGLGSAVSRATSGYVANYLNPILFYFVTSIVCAAAILLMALVQSHWGFYLLGCIFGGCHGIFCVLQSLKVAHVYGKDNMAIIWGFGMTLGCFGVLAGPPIGGLIADRTGSYDGTLAFYSSILLVSGFSALTVYFLHKRRLKAEFSYKNGEINAELGTKFIDSNSNKE